MGLVDMVKAETRVKTAVNSLMSEREIEHGLVVDNTMDIEEQDESASWPKNENKGGPVNTKFPESALAMLSSGKAKDHTRSQQLLCSVQTGFTI
ncbi:hypothetical protein [Brevibacillus sp. HD3.3A]|uniref:hypothetical protein n=1 Tax=Brevibacillus sp. HD3.3A TaxID=2738979 RepID=UPI001E2A64F9|nr:hypothetical protein [Brevibacillus sp. HD3.3A]UED72161.1 hypothetical protein HP435_29080 [Brevibacillus sp. HD3.3A]